jgi:hypothetical protein
MIAATMLLSGRAAAHQGAETARLVEQFKT